MEDGAAVAAPATPLVRRSSSTSAPRRWMGTAPQRCEIGYSRSAIVIALARWSRPKPSSANSGSSQRSRVTVVARSPAGSLASSVANVVQAPWSSVQDRLTASRRRRPETRW